MSERFFVPELAADAPCWTLEGEEAHHLAKVCRAKPGDAVQLFNGAGLRASATVIAVGKRTVELEVSNANAALRPAGLILGAALPKGERTDWLIEKAVELGVDRLTPLGTERAVTIARDAKLERLKRKIVEACKQCGRDWLMELGEPAPLSDFLQTKPTAEVGWVLDPTGEAVEGVCGWSAVGPEGGFTPSELIAARTAGWKVVALPGHVLRSETAALAIAARASGRSR